MKKNIQKNRRLAAIFTIQGVPNAVYPKIFAVAAESGLLNWVVYLREVAQIWFPTLAKHKKKHTPLLTFVWGDVDN